MTKFIGRLALLATLLLVTNLVFIFLTPLDPTYYYFEALIDKHRILEQAPSPKIVFVGGSNLAFGIDSELIQQKLGLPVVNMGLQGGLGLRYMLEEIKPELKPGDVVVLIPEYEQYLFLFDGQVQLWQILNIAPSYVKYITSIKQYVVMFRNYPIFLQGKLHGLILGSGQRDPIYYREAFNQYGDLISHLNQGAPKKINPERWSWGSEDTVAESISALNDFYATIQKQNVKAFVTFPSIAETGYKTNLVDVELIDRKLKQDLQIPILSSPTDYIYPDDYFFDTLYHLGAKGRKLRTEKVITELARVLNK